jgi:hypothetical protein
MFYLSPNLELTYSYLKVHGHLVPAVYICDDDTALHRATYADLCAGLERLRNLSAEFQAPSKHSW